MGELLAEFQALGWLSRHHTHHQRQPFVEQVAYVVDAADVVLLGDGTELAARVHRQIDVLATAVEATQEARRRGRAATACVALRASTTANAVHLTDQDEQFAGGDGARPFHDSVDVVRTRNVSFDVLTHETRVGELAHQLGHGLDALDGLAILVEDLEVAVETLRNGQLWPYVDGSVVVFEFHTLYGDTDARTGAGHYGRRRQVGIGQRRRAQSQIVTLDEANHLRQVAPFDHLLQVLVLVRPPRRGQQDGAVRSSHLQRSRLGSLSRVSVPS